MMRARSWRAARISPARQTPPVARLTRTGATITRADVWPTEAEYGRPVILAGGEVGLLRAWWTALDQSAWRWSLEFYNRR